MSDVTSTSQKTDDAAKEARRLNLYRKAGQISYEVLQLAKEKIKPGMQILELCEFIEDEIKKRGALIGFPANVSVNNIAAHYTSPHGDTTVIPDKSLVKIDIGARFEGFVADTALTVSFNPEYDKMVKVAEEAFRAAIEIAKAGTRPSEMGSIIEEIIKEQGYRPIRELGGHLIEEYDLHGSVMLPNIHYDGGPNEPTLVKGKIYALEVFVSNGEGSIHEVHQKAAIYALTPERVPIRSKFAREIVRHIYQNYKTLPFAERWLYPHFKPAHIRFTLQRLSQTPALHRYGPLVENDKEAMVSQYEHTFIVHDDSVELITEPPFKTIDEGDAQSAEEE